MAKKRRNRKKKNSYRGLYALAAVIVLVISLIVGLKVSINPPSDTELTVHYIDVGQGDAILIEAPTGENMLIDAGPGASEEKLLAYLSENGIKTLDYFVLTHPDEDHIGGADRVFETCTVSEVLLPDCEKDTKAYRNLEQAILAEQDCLRTTPESADVIDFCEGGEITVMAPNAPEYADVNDYSIVLRLEYYDTTFLFTGDAGKASEEQMLSVWGETELECDVLKVGHHGSRTASTTAFIEAVDPEYAVISCAKGNKYGHPHAEVLDLLEKEDIQICRTDKEGSIVIISNGTAVSVANT